LNRKGKQEREKEYRIW